MFHSKYHHHQHFCLENQSQKFENWRKCITIVITWTLNNYFSLINWFKFIYFLKLWQNCSIDMSRDQDHCSWPLFNMLAKGVEVGRSMYIIQSCKLRQFSEVDTDFWKLSIVDRESSKHFRSVLKTCIVH